MSSLCLINQSGFLKRPKIQNYRRLCRNTSEKASALRFTVFSISLKSSSCMFSRVNKSNIYCLRSCSSVNQDMMVQESATMNYSQERHPTLQCRMEHGQEMHIHMHQASRIKYIFNKTNLVFHLTHTCAVWTHRGQLLRLQGNKVYEQKIFTVQILVGKGAENNTQNRLFPVSGLQCYFGCQQYTKFPLKGKSNQFPWGWRHPKTRWGYSISAYAFSKRMSGFTLNPCQTTRTGW